MENTGIDLTLKHEWDNLRYELRKNNKVAFSSFEDTFTKTYLFFKELNAKTVIEKKNIEVIVSASLFANSPNPESDFICAAMFTLTERMLSCCALTTSEEPVTGTMVYLFEARKEVYIDFSNVKDSMNRLVALFREDYWDNL